MKIKIKIAIASIISLVIAVASPLSTYAQTSNEIDVYKTLRGVSQLKNIDGDSSWDNVQYGWHIVNNNQVYGLNIITNANTDVKKGDLVKFNIVIITESAPIDVGNIALPPTCMSSGADWSVIDCDIQATMNADKEYTMQSLSGTQLWCGNSQLACNMTINVSGTPAQNFYYFNSFYFSYTLKANRDFNSNSVQTTGWFLRYQNNGSGNAYFLFRVSDLSFFTPMKDTATEINNQQQEAGQQAQQDGQTGSNSSQQSAEQGSASLLQGASSIIGALTNTEQGSCTINLNMGSVDLGQQNFCQGDIGPLRPVIATITNILFAFVAFRVFAFLIGVMFGLFDEFFGTKTEKGGA